MRFSESEMRSLPSSLVDDVEEFRQAFTARHDVESVPPGLLSAVATSEFARRVALAQWPAMCCATSKRPYPDGSTIRISYGVNCAASAIDS